MPLLESSAAIIDLTAAARTLALFVEKLASAPLPGKLAQETRALDSECILIPDASRRAVAWLLDKDDYASAAPGLLHYFGWIALARYLCPMMDAFAKWRDEERWLRVYCPTCGSRPMHGSVGGHRSCAPPTPLLRLLQNTLAVQTNRMSILRKPERSAVSRFWAIEGEGGLRIDYCETCRGYLKTYEGEGCESVLLADWTSIHLDFIASDRGLKRLAASLYTLPI